MDNITQFVFMLHGFAKFNEVQPNIKQWNKIRTELNLVGVLAPLQFQELITVINNVEQVPTSAQWREIKTIAEETINQLRMEVDLTELYSSRMDDDIGCYEIEDDFLPEAHYDYEPRLCVTATEIKMDPLTYTKSLDWSPITISVVDNSALVCDEIKVIDDFIANSYKQKQFDF